MTTLDWCRKNLPSLVGKRALVTGAAGGLGYETAAGLAAMGAMVILADRNVEGGQAAVRNIRSASCGAHVEFRELDRSNRQDQKLRRRVWRRWRSAGHPRQQRRHPAAV